MYTEKWVGFFFWPTERVTSAIDPRYRCAPPAARSASFRCTAGRCPPVECLRCIYPLCSVTAGDVRCLLGLCPFHWWLLFALHPVVTPGDCVPCHCAYYCYRLCSLSTSLINRWLSPSATLSIYCRCLRVLAHSWWCALNALFVSAPLMVAIRSRCVSYASARYLYRHAMHRCLLICTISKVLMRYAYDLLILLSIVHSTCEYSYEYY